MNLEYWPPLKALSFLFFLEWGVALESFYSLASTITMKHRPKRPKKILQSDTGTKLKVLILEGFHAFCKFLNTTSFQRSRRE